MFAAGNSTSPSGEPAGAAPMVVGASSSGGSAAPPVPAVRAAPSSFATGRAGPAVIIDGMTPRHPSCACGRTDIAHHDHITGAPLCVACFKLLGDLIRWLNGSSFDASRHEWEHLWPGHDCAVCVPEPR